MFFLFIIYYMDTNNDHLKQDLQQNIFVRVSSSGYLHLLELLGNKIVKLPLQRLSKKEKTLFFLQRVPPAIVGRLKVRGLIPLAVCLSKRAILTVP